MDVSVRFALASCQDYVGRYYYSWRDLVEEEERSGPIHFVLFLGDYIYEYETGSDVIFTGSKERRVELPHGLMVEKAPGFAVRAAFTLEDYRYLYKTYKTDPDLQRVHELYPFLVIWDDHEFANDAWQDHANDFEGMQGDEKETARREAATRAFYEYIPVDVPYRTEAGFPRDLTLYRSFTYGKHLTLVLTDQRYYRSDHVIREDELDFRSGKFLPFSPLGARIFAVKEAFDEKEAASGVTMLGEPQREWVIRTLLESDSTWKCLASPTVMAQMVLDLSRFESLPPSFRRRFYFKTDQWDGYRSERKRLLSTLKDLENLLVLSGDIHGFYGSRLYVDFDTLDQEVGLEFVCAGISSSPVREQVERIVQGNPLLRRFFSALLPLFDENLLDSNPHIFYANGKGYGYLLVEVEGTKQVRVLFRETDDVTRKEGPLPFTTLECSVVPGKPPRLERMGKRS